MSIFDYDPKAVGMLPYWKWNRVLPAVYDDSLSQYEILCKLLYKVNEIITNSNSMGEQVEQLTQLVQQLIDGEFPTGIVQYVTDIANAAVDEDIEAVNASIDALESQIDTINTTLSTLSVNKNHIIVLGDSLSRYSYQNNAVVNSGAELWTKVAAMTGVTVHNFSVGGAGFINTTYTTSTIGVQANQAIADTSIDPDRVRCIVVFAGTNDYGVITDVAPLQTAVRTVWSTLANSRFNKIPIYFVFNQAGYGSHYTIISSLVYGLSEANYQAPVKGFNANSWLRWYDNIGVDNVHPNNFGYNTLANRLAQIITTGDCNFIDRPIITASNPYDAITRKTQCTYDGKALDIFSFYSIPAGEYAGNPAGAEILSIPHLHSVIVNDYGSTFNTPISFPSATIANIVGNAELWYGICGFNEDDTDAIHIKISHPAFTNESYATHTNIHMRIPC